MNILEQRSRKLVAVLGNSAPKKAHGKNCSATSHWSVEDDYSQFPQCSVCANPATLCEMEMIRISLPKCREISWLIVILALIFGEPAVATTAIAFRSDKRLILAADSYSTLSDGTHGSECKIFGVGTFFFTMSGLPYDRKRGYEAKRIVEEGISHPGDFAQRVQVTEELLKQGLSAELRRLKSEDPTTYVWVLEPEHHVLQVAFAQYENGKPHLAALDFQFDSNSASFNMTRKNCPGSCDEHGEAYYLGRHEAIDVFVPTNKKFTDPTTYFTKLINLEISAHPGDVGPPIDILQIDISGPKWLVGGTTCDLH